jgi:hypothetical protein
VALLKGGIGCTLLLAPKQVAALLHVQATSLEVSFARLTGVALLFRALLAVCLRVSVFVIRVVLGFVLGS